MNTFIECRVEKPLNAMGKIIRVIAVIAAAICLLFGVFGHWLMLFAGMALCFAAYWIYLNTDIEYEYLYQEKELTVDKIMAKSTRKTMGSYVLDKMEIIAESGAWQLDAYKNRQVEVLDYSSGKKTSNTYVIYYDGNKKIVFEPSEEMVKQMKNSAPSKIFTN
ncbi:MAG: hypothetical protein PHP50_07495 [Lachnospiraceae bacterium]|nr:hypothetical protein [Lachnospiraceae bacterium]